MTETLLSPLTGIYSVAKVQQRTLPTSTNDITHEVIHPSVLHQANPIPELSQVLEEHPELLHTLLPWEENTKEAWAGRLEATSAFKVQAKVASTTHHSHDFVHKAVEAIKHLKHGDQGDQQAQNEAHSAYVSGWLGKVVSESSVGAVVQELIKK